MMTSWWVWMALFFVFVVSPIGYGWGYRGWGPPVPRYVQKKRGKRVPATGATVVNHEAWGWAGDFVWVFAFICLGWAAMTIFWRAGPW